MSSSLIPSSKPNPTADHILKLNFQNMQRCRQARGLCKENTLLTTSTNHTLGTFTLFRTVLSTKGFSVQSFLAERQGMTLDSGAVALHHQHVASMSYLYMCSRSTDKAMPTADMLKPRRVAAQCWKTVTPGIKSPGGRCSHCSQRALSTCVSHLL